jgi:nucleoside-diphosphate-sugar epimerase
MRVTIIGGTGHIGSYLVPRLVGSGHEVAVIARGTRQPYFPDDRWNQVNRIFADREAGERDGSWAQLIGRLETDAVVDLTCFKLESARCLAEALAGDRRPHLLHCGTIWVYGRMAPVTAEDAPRAPLETYGREKAAIEEYFLTMAQEDGFPATVLHPGHIVGQGWWPLNPQGNFNPEVFAKLAAGQKIALPDDGSAMLHHVHADDLAQAFHLALEEPAASIGHSFNIASPHPLTLRAYATAVAHRHDREPCLEFLPFDKWEKSLSTADREQSRRHIAHNSQVSIEKAQRILGYKPRYLSIQAVAEAVDRDGSGAHSRPA